MTYSSEVNASQDVHLRAFDPPPTHSNGYSDPSNAIEAGKDLL